MGTNRAFFISLIGLLGIIIFGVGTILPMTQAKPFRVTLAGAFSSQRIYRGAITWPKPTVILGPAFIFYERLKLAGPALNYSFFDQAHFLELKTGFRFYSDGKPWISFSDHREDHRNQRKSSLEANFQIKYKFGPRKKFSISGFLGRDIKEYNGFYSALSLRVPVWFFTSLSGKLGWAEKSTAIYLYGLTAREGFADADLTLNTIFPFVPWKGVAMFYLKRSWILEGENRSANYVVGQAINNTFGFRLIWNLGHRNSAGN